MTARLPPEIDAPAGWLVWTIRLVALVVVVLTLALALGLAVRIFRIVAGVG